MKKKICCSLILLLILEVFFFRHLFIYNTLIGDSGDGLLNNLIVEHWYNFYCGKAVLSDLPIFYPMHNTLSYTDMLLAFSFPYSILRVFGLNMLTSNEITLIAFHCFGVISLFYLLFIKMKISLTASFVGIILTFYSSAFYNKFIHTQFFALVLLPLLMIFLFNLKNEYSKTHVLSLKYCFSIVILLAVLLYTSWYVGFFTCLFALIYCIVFLVQNHKNILVIANEIKKNYRNILISIVCEILLLIPFARAYLPTKELTGTWNWDTVSYMLPRWFDFFNVSGHNLVWGRLYSSQFFYNRPYAHELFLGFGFLTFALLVLAFLYYIKNRQKDVFYSTTGLVILISFLLLLKIHGFSLWYIIYKFIPGASSVRAASRYMFFLSFPAGLIIAKYWNDYLAIKLKHILPIALLIVPIFLFIENINVFGYDKAYNKAEFNNFINNASMPINNLPMYIINTSQNDSVSPDVSQLKAWMIANKYRLKTINGYSGKFPIAWNFFDIYDKHYKEHINEWMFLNDIHDVQEYDSGTNTWSIRDIQPITGPVFTEGWYAQEYWGRWSSAKRSVIIMQNCAKNTLLLELHTFATPHNVTLYVDNIEVAKLLVTEKATFTCKLPEAAVTNKKVKITLITDGILKSPNEIGQSADYRKLGIGISKILLTNGD